MTESDTGPSRGRRRPVGRRGLRARPEEGWPLDEVLVGVGTLRTLRELFTRERRFKGSAPRPWDLALWNGVTPQGSANSLERLDREGLVYALPPERPGRARRYRLDRSHPLVPPLARLFNAERAMAPPVRWMKWEGGDGS